MVELSANRQFEFCYSRAEGKNGPEVAVAVLDSAHGVSHDGSHRGDGKQGPHDSTENPLMRSPHMGHRRLVEVIGHAAHLDSGGGL
jgi:hypothetical protein